jgi:hypothetical protein
MELGFMAHAPDQNMFLHEFPPQPTETELPSQMVAPDGGVTEDFSRRGFLGLAARTVATTGIVLAGAELIDSPQAEAKPDGDPSDPPRSPTQEDRLRAEIDALVAEKNLNDAQRREIEDRLQPLPPLRRFGKDANDVLGSLALLGGVSTVAGATIKYFIERAKDRRNAEEAMRIKEDENYDNLIKEIGVAIEKVSDAEAHLRRYRWNPRRAQVNYGPLHRAYNRLKPFTANPRYVEAVLDEVTTDLRDRAKSTIDMPASQVEKRLNADRELVELLARLAPNLPRPADRQGVAALPNARGISLNGMRFLRLPLEALDMEGAYLQNLMITGSLAGSHFRLAHFDGSTFGEPGDACDLRGADLSRADLKGATFAHILIDANTKFGGGEEGNPSATFGNVTSDDTLTETQREEKIAAAQAVIDAWQKEHPEVELDIPSQPRTRTRLTKLLQSVGIS